MAKERKKKVKIPFWKKKVSPELKHLTDHAGKIIDNSNISQLRDAILDIGLVYFGIRAFGLHGAIIGPVSLRLATAMNPIAGAAGVIGLVTMGLCNQGPVQDFITAMLDPGQVMVGGELMPIENVVAPSFSPDFPYELICPEGYDLKRGPSAAFCVLRR